MLIRLSPKQSLQGVVAAALLLTGIGSSPIVAQSVTLRTPPQSARVYARDGSLIAELGPEVRTVVSMKSLPAYVPRAFVAVEDKRFYEHQGVDPLGVARAIKKNLEGDREGASTITQQLIGNMFPETVNRREQTVERKVREARLAVELEQRYGKNRILEAYLNEIYFGHGWYGIESAAQHYFGKPAAKLSIEETAMLAALPKGAGVYSPKINPQKALERRNLVLGIMAENGVITAAQAAAARQRPIRLAPNHGYSARPEWVIEQVRQFMEANFGKNYGTQGLRVWTTIDPVVQNAADSALVEGLSRAERLPWYKGPKFAGAKAKATVGGTNYLQGLVVSVDARTGEIVAMRGGRSWQDSKFNRVTAARRQPGSAFKPIVYSSAFERGVGPSTVMEDTALRIQLPGSPLYQPKNSDNRFRGPVTVRQALTESINTIAIQLGMQVGLPTMVATARRFGIASTIPPYPSSAIGAGAVRPLELAGAYTAFANGGLRVEPFLIRRVVDLKGATVFDHRPRGSRTVSPAVAFMVTDLLRDAAEKGTGREARERLPARVPMAGKTGTTNGGTDVWYVGYTPDMVTAVWVGFDKPAPIGTGAFGGTLAAPIWGEMMRDVYAKRRVPGAWPVPAELVTVAADAATGLPLAGACPPVAARREYFLAGTQPQGACVVQAGRVVASEPLPDDSLPADTLGVDTARAPTPSRRP